MQTEICNAAIDLYDRFRANDVAALLDHAQAQPVECPGHGIAPSPLCDGLADGTMVQGYLISSGGEGIYDDAAALRQRLERGVQHAQTAVETGDEYGPGTLRIAAIGCFSEPSLPEAECGRDWIEVTLTYISETPPPGSVGGGVGRHFTCLEMYWPADGAPGLSGIGCGVPPDAYLGPFDIAAGNSQGVDGRFRNHPWSPPDEMLGTYSWSTRTGIAAVDAVLEAVEEGTPPPYDTTPVACVKKQEGIGAPPLCPEGVTDGTPIDVILVSDCEGVYVEPDAEQPISFTYGDLTPVYRLIGIREDHANPGGYVIVYGWSLEDGVALAGTLGIGSNGLAYHGFGCGSRLEDAENHDATWVLAPRQ